MDSSALRDIARQAMVQRGLLPVLPSELAASMRRVSEMQAELRARGLG